MANKKQLSQQQLTELIATLKQRFEKNQNRHIDITWTAVHTKLVTCAEGNSACKAKLWSLYQMEYTEGEPDVVLFNAKTETFLFIDCSAESPAGRRSLCYDRNGLESRKEHRPTDSALDVAAAMGIELLDETSYRALQQLGKFDTKTSSWLKTPDPIRKLGGAIFADYRYGQVFIYHNGASSYYAARGFRGCLLL